LVVRGLVAAEVGLVKAFVLLSLQQVLLDDFYLADAIDLILLETGEVQVNQLQNLLLHLLLVLGTHELTVVQKLLPFQHQHQQLEQFFPDLDADVGSHDSQSWAVLLFHDTVPESVEVAEPIKDIFGVLDKILLEVRITKLVIGLGHIVNGFGREALILGLQTVLLHLFKSFLGI
jgi:hypothetical protein